MKNIITLFLLFYVYSVFAGFPQGDHEKMYKDALQFKTVLRTITAGGVNPTLVATPGEPGDLYLGSGSMFIKTDSGTSVNWNIIVDGLVDLTSEVTGVLPVANGGTNSSTALNSNLVIVSLAGAIVENSNDVSTTELSYLDGVTSAIQTQLDSKVDEVASTDEAVVRFNGTTGSVQNSSVLIDDTNNISGIVNLTATGTTTLNTGLTGVAKLSSGVVSASDVNMASEVTGVLPVANGGTNSSTALNDNLVMVSASGAIVENANDISTTELSQLNGITSGVVSLNDTQTLTNKTITAPTISNPTLSGVLTITGKFNQGSLTETIDPSQGLDWTDFFQLTNTIPNGTPVTGTSHIGRQFQADLAADDDMVLGPLGFGWAGHGIISSISVTSGHTVAESSLVSAVPLIPASSTGGVITDFKYLSLVAPVNQGGTSPINNQVGINVPSTFCAEAAGTCHALYNASSADMFTAGDLTISGSSFLTINATTAVDAVLDEDNMVSDSATSLATQQSIKAYVDAQVAAGGTNVVSKTTTATLLTTEDVILADSTGGAFTISLPTAVGNSGKIYDLIKEDNNFTVITIDADGTELINGLSTTTLNTVGESLRIVSDNVGWKILQRSTPAIWMTYTPTFSVTNATIAAKWFRRGEHLLVESIITFSGASATTTTLPTPLPSGLTINTTSMVSTLGSVKGGGNLFDNGTGFLAITPFYDTNTTIAPRAHSVISGQNYLVQCNPNADSPMVYASGDYIKMNFEVPILGWYE